MKKRISILIMCISIMLFSMTLMPSVASADIDCSDQTVNCYTSKGPQRYVGSFMAEMCWDLVCKPCNKYCYAQQCNAEFSACKGNCVACYQSCNFCFSPECKCINKNGIFSGC